MGIALRELFNQGLILGIQLALFVRVADAIFPTRFCFGKRVLQDEVV